jgi:hypothetical protein
MTRGEDHGASIGCVVVLMMVVIACFGWAFAAAAYAHEMEDWGSGTGKAESLIAFFVNALVHVPLFFQVVGFAFSKRLWLVIVFGALEVFAILVGVGLKRIEKEWSKLPNPPPY